MRNLLPIVASILSMTVIARACSIVYRPGRSMIENAADSREMTIDEIIMNAADSPDITPKMPTKCEIKVELDMVYSCEEWAEIQRLNANNHGATARTAGIKPGGHNSKRWTNNIIPYIYEEGSSPQRRRIIQSAIADWERYTCLRFYRDHSTSPRNKIGFLFDTIGCSSFVGMLGGAQPVGLGPGCYHKKIVIHELGHAIGLHHEHQSPDRDNYVKIIKRNITPKYRYAFNKSSWNIIMDMGIPYDYYSIMHYGGKSFSANGGITMKTKNPHYQNIIGHVAGLSFRDIKSVNIMYSCKPATCSKRHASCPGEGFVGKDCRCWCRGPDLMRPVKHCGWW